MSVPRPSPVYEELDWGLCATLAKWWHDRQKKYSRYHHFRTIHVTDVIECPIKVLVFRLYDITPPCRMLFYMKEGLEWERKALQALKESGRDPKYIQKLRAIAITREGATFAFVKTPDYESPEELIEIKWTRWSPKEIWRIILAKQTLAEHIWGRGTYYPPIAVNLRIWPTWIYQVVGYLYFNELAGKPLPPKRYIFAQRHDHVDLIEIRFRPGEYDWFKRKFEEKLRKTAHLFKQYHDWFFAPMHRLESIVYEELAPIYREIWRNGELYAEIEYKCRLCPLMYVGCCPGLIPLRRFRFWAPDELEVLKNIMRWSPALQEYLHDLTITFQGRVTNVRDVLVRLHHRDYPAFLRALQAQHNRTEVIVEMVKAAMKNVVRAFRAGPREGRTVFYTHA